MDLMRRLTRNGSGDVDPEWSPNGKRIAYQCRAAHGSQALQRNGEICTMAADGSGKRRLTNNDFGDLHPSWSPSGRWIVFTRVFEPERNVFKWDLFKMRTNGSHLRRLTDTDAFDGYPSWAPDGRRIAFVNDSTGNQDVYTMRPDGSGIRNLSETTDQESDPAWSPSSGRIVYSRFLDSDTDWVLSDAQGWQVFAMRADGSRPQQLTEDEQGLDLAPSWSPSGSQIVFSRHDDLWKMKADGSRERRLTGTAGTTNSFEVDADWQ